MIELLGDKAVSEAVVAKVKTAGLWREPRRQCAAFLHSYEIAETSVVHDKILEMNNVLFEKHVGRMADVLAPKDLATLKTIHRACARYLGFLMQNFSTGGGNAAFDDEYVIEVHEDAKGKLQYNLLAELARRRAMSEIFVGMVDETVMLVSNASSIISSETHNGNETGRAIEIVHKAHREDPIVFKRARPDACDECKAAFMIGVRPRTFLLSELLANGNNIGQPRRDRLPVVESLHPYCSCMLMWCPPGFDFDDDGHMIHVGVK